jgi:hypothetical protein
MRHQGQTLASVCDNVADGAASGCIALVRGADAWGESRFEVSTAAILDLWWMPAYVRQGGYHYPRLTRWLGSLDNGPHSLGTRNPRHVRQEVRSTQDRDCLSPVRSLHLDAPSPPATVGRPLKYVTEASVSLRANPTHAG